MGIARGGSIPLDRTIPSDSQRKRAVRQLERVSGYCGVEVLSYAVMSNHFHLLVRVPAAEAISDGELVRRVGVLYGGQRGVVEALRATLELGGEEAVLARGRHLAQMHDISTFMKLLKQRFSRWYNADRERYGTLWAERFKSVLVEPSYEALSTVAAYINLNPLRAGLCEDPAEYRHCSYAAALGGSVSARRGLAICCEQPRAGWGEVQQTFRMILFGSGAKAPVGKQAIRSEEALKVLREGGALPLATLLRLRIRYLIDGLALGSPDFVASWTQATPDGVPLPKRTPRALQKRLGPTFPSLSVLGRLRGETIS